MKWEKNIFVFKQILELAYNAKKTWNETVINVAGYLTEGDPWYGL